MQNLIVSVIGEEGGLIAAVGHRYAWVGETSSRFSPLPGVARTNSSRYDSQPTRGRTRPEILSTGDEIKVLWDGELKPRGKSKESVSRVEVQFDFNDYRNAGRKR